MRMIVSAYLAILISTPGLAAEKVALLIGNGGYSSITSLRPARLYRAIERPNEIRTLCAKVCEPPNIRRHFYGNLTQIDYSFPTFRNATIPA